MLCHWKWLSLILGAQLPFLFLSETVRLCHSDLWFSATHVLENIASYSSTLGLGPGTTTSLVVTSKESHLKQHKDPRRENVQQRGGWTWVSKLLSYQKMMGKAWSGEADGQVRGHLFRHLLKKQISWCEIEEYSNHTLKWGIQPGKQRKKPDLTWRASVKPSAGAWAFTGTSGLRTGDKAQGPGWLGSPRDGPAERRHACSGLEPQSGGHPQ